MRACERLQKYIRFDTASCEANECCPSTPGQKILGAALVEELLSLGLKDARMDDSGYVYASLPATDAAMPAIGLIAHMDTVDCVPVLPMNERIIENYDGSDITLESGDILSVKDTPALKNCIGKNLMVTDGRTLLGADDKAGIAEIMTAVERIVSTDAPHGKACIAFTPDEEIGRGADRFDLKAFGAEFAYTVDGDEVGCIEYESFNAASLTLTFHGKSVHPGSAKNSMVQAPLLAMEYNAMLPEWERPEHTEGREGFYYLEDISGDTEKTVCHYIIRDHDRNKFEARKAFAADIAGYMNKKYPGRVEAEIRDSYYNMREVLEPHMDIIHRAEDAYRRAGVDPFSKPIRGGTDGSKLSFMGLPCPNLATGGMNCHGRFECIAIEDMDTMVNMLVKLLVPSEA